MFLHPDRALQFGYQAENPYTDFVCHKTGVSYENDWGSSEIGRGENSLTCAGFKGMQNLINGIEDDFEIDFDDHFSDPQEMEEHHAEEYYKEK